MNNQNLLDVIGQAQESYLLSAIQTRKERDPVKTKSRKPTSLSRKILIAAAIIMLLALTACAAKYVSNLFVTYFQDEGRREISDSQIEYIQSNTQPSIADPIVTEPENGYSVSVRSALTDGNIAYITVDIKAPEDVSLDGGRIRFYDNPLLIPEQTEGLVIAPDGSSPDAMCDYETIDDGDGLSNTASIMFKVNPFKEDDSLNPFDGSIHWRLKAGGFYKWVLHSEDIALGEGTWEFDLHFQKIDTTEMSFLSEPISVMTSYWPGDEFVNENRILSFTLSGLSWCMELEKPEIDGEMQNIGDTSIVMKDGTRQTLLRLTSQKNNSLIVPIVVGNVDYILLTDGTKLYPQS